MMKKKSLFLIVIVIAALVLSACDVSKKDVANIMITEKIEIDDVKINVSDKDVVIEYKLIPENEKDQIIMTVADETIATVDDGKISAVAEGETLLTISTSVISETVKVTVLGADVSLVEKDKGLFIDNPKSVCWKCGSSEHDTFAHCTYPSCGKLDCFYDNHCFTCGTTDHTIHPGDAN